MTTKPKVKKRSFQSRRRAVKMLLRLRPYGTYIDEFCLLETILDRKPSRLQLDLIGTGELPPDAAFVMRSILRQRSPSTKLITHARSSLQGPSVLLWLLGDTRLMRDDARFHLRPAGPFSPDGGAAWKERNPLDEDAFEEDEYIRVLEAINEYLPVRELAGQPIGRATLQEYGLLDSDYLDAALATAFHSANPTREKPEPRVKKRIKQATR